MRLLDIVALLANVYKGDAHAEVGFVDPRETLDSLTRKLNKCVLVDPNVLESCLWSCNMLAEMEPSQFWHPSGLDFKQFVHKILRGASFDTTYNLIAKEEDEDGHASGK